MDSIQLQFGISQSIYLQAVYNICINFVVIHHLGLYKYHSILSFPYFNGEIEKKIASSIDTALKFKRGALLSEYQNLLNSNYCRISDINY